jgi:hypothetical protein
MFCSRSVSVHLLRGLGAVALVALAIVSGRQHIWLVPPLGIGALVLMRGCPMCWLMGLIETLTIQRGRATLID